MKNKFGFTLAEVLITLVIIGVVAALTIPTAINRMQREELRSQFKKAVSTTYQVIQKMKVDYGDIVFDYNNSYYSDIVTFRNKFKSYFHVVCEENCVDMTKYQNFSGTDSLLEEPYFMYPFIVQDGVAYGFDIGSSSHVAYISFDINGPGKKPNRLGYDVFAFYIKNSQLLPCDVSVPASSLFCSSSNTAYYNGYGCTKKALTDANYFKNLP